MRVWVCPGSYDPITLGHMDIINRATKMCDKLIIAVGKNSKKNYVFSADERVDLIKQCVAGMNNIEVDKFDGLLIDYAKKRKATAIVKGLRAVSDFEYEMQMALLNKKMNWHIESVFLMTSINYSHLSSSAVRVIASNGGNIKGLVPEAIRESVIKKLYKGGV